MMASLKVAASLRLGSVHVNDTTSGRPARTSAKVTWRTKLQHKEPGTAMGIGGLSGLVLSGAAHAEEAAPESFAAAAAAIQEATAAIQEVMTEISGETPVVAVEDIAVQPAAVVDLISVEELVEVAQPAVAAEPAAAAVQGVAAPVAADAGNSLQNIAQLATTAIEVPPAAQDSITQSPAVEAAAASFPDVVQPIAGAAAAVQDFAQPALAAAEPIIKAGLEGVQKGLEGVLSTSVGVSVDTATLSATSDAAAGFTKQALDFVTSSDPARLGEEALSLAAVAYLLPPLASASLKALRGYAGDVLPTTALDALASQGGNSLIDIRPAKEKEALGVPDLADNTKLVELEYVTVGDSKLSTRLRNALEVEAELTAVEIAALKKLNKGNTLYIMDGNGSISKAVAKELGKRGFGKVFIISGGYQAWTNAKLRTKPWNTTAALLPSKSSSSVH